MPMPGDEVVHPVTGERLRFEATAASTGGRRLAMVDEWPADHRVPAHRHPAVAERWEVLEGEATITVDGAEHRLRAGDGVTAPAGATHSGANTGEGPARLRLTFEPAGRWEEVALRLFGGPHEPDGSPTTALLLALLREYPDEIAPPAAP